MKAPQRIQIVGRLPRDLRKALGAAARKQKRSMNAVLEEALRKHLSLPAPKESGR
jgi:predicted HicB family RNase H-like nuclease